MSSARYGPPDCAGVSSGVAALAVGALVGCWDGTEGFGAGRVVSLNRGRPLLALSSVPALATARTSSDGARGDTEPVLAGASAEVNSFAGRAGEGRGGAGGRRAGLSSGGLVPGLAGGTSCGRSVGVSGSCSAGCPGPLEGGAVKSCPVRGCPVIHPASDSTRTAIASPLTTPSTRITVSTRAGRSSTRSSASQLVQMPEDAFECKPPRKRDTTHGGVHASCVLGGYDPSRAQTVQVTIL